MMTTWKEFQHKNYTGVAVWFSEDDKRHGEWVGEFNYPIRRVVHAFMGKTLEQAHAQFVRGVEAYYAQVSSVGMLRPEPEGILGVAELAEMDRRGREYELTILDWPPTIPQNFVLIVKDLVSLSRTTIGYNQSALDELRVLLEAQPAITLKAFRSWAERVWRRGELERTSAGMAISKNREVDHV